MMRRLTNKLGGSFKGAFVSGVFFDDSGVNARYGFQSAGRRNIDVVG